MTTQPLQSETQPRQYKVFFVNHEEPMYRTAWVVPGDFVMPQGHEEYTFLGLMTVSDPQLIKSIDEEIRDRNTFRLGANA